MSHPSGILTIGPSSSELSQKSDVVFVEHPDIVYGILEHGKPLHTHTEGKACVLATAILAGDALLTLAFQTLASMEGHRPECGLEVIRAMAFAAGPHGMVQGQMLDMQAEGRMLTLAELQRLHRLKTGALIEAALACGAMVGGGSSAQIDAVREYGRRSV